METAIGSDAVMTGRKSAAKKVTSKRVARVASKVLRDGRYSKAAKKPAGSALAQHPGGKRSR